MKKILFVVLFIIKTTFAQDYETLNKYIGTNGQSYLLGDVISIKSGSLEDGKFRSISYKGLMQLNANKNMLTSNNSDNTVYIKKIKKYDNETYKGVYFFVSSKENKNFIIDINKAITNCEISNCQKIDHEKYSSIKNKKEFKLTSEKLTDYVVVNTLDIEASDLYNYSIDWIKDNYTNPEKVIKATFKNKKIRIQGIKTDALTTKAFGLNDQRNLRYSIEISFKDGKYKFNPISLEEYISYNKYVQSLEVGWNKILIKTMVI